MFHRLFTRSLSRTLCLLFAMIYLTALVLASPLPQMPQTGAGSSQPMSSNPLPSSSAGLSQPPPSENLKTRAMTVGNWDWDSNVWRTWQTQRSSSVSRGFCFFMIKKHCYGINTEGEVVKLEHSNRTMANANNVFRHMRAVLDLDQLKEEGSGLWNDLLKVEVNEPRNDEVLFHALSNYLQKKRIIHGYDSMSGIEGNMVKNQKPRGSIPGTTIHFGFLKPDRKLSLIQPWINFSRQKAGIGRNSIPFLCYSLLNRCYGYDPLRKEFHIILPKLIPKGTEMIIDPQFHPIAKPELKETALDKKAEYEEVLLNKDELEKRTGYKVEDTKSGNIAAFKYLHPDLVGYEWEDESYIPYSWLTESTMDTNDGPPQWESVN
ncbi:hypothetical protein FB446DRAFT_707887 [Lentinula raphanica]|nr:hypothetical protein FB446DRAFT_707887 [Lentinula raphanica]